MTPIEQTISNRAIGALVQPQKRRTKTRNLPSKNTECETAEYMGFAVTLSRKMRFRDNYQLASVSFSNSAVKTRRAVPTITRKK
jgi:hypothetical protein